MNDQQNIRDMVSQAYAEAVMQPAQGGCCGGGVPKGVAAKIAGYTREELATLPVEAVVNSFGCGNPLAFAELREGDVVLDLGSGAGIDILLAGKKVGPRGQAIGIDMTDEMIVKARENIAASGLTNVEVRQGIIENLPVESCTIDWVISNCVINLSPEKSRVFKEIARVLKSGGRVSVSDIVVRDLPDEVRRSPALYSSCLAGAIAEEEYVAGLRAAGLAEVEVRERLVYAPSHLAGLIKSELPANAREFRCCGSKTESLDQLATRLGTMMAGRVWSAKFFARKP